MICNDAENNDMKFKWNACAEKVVSNLRVNQWHKKEFELILHTAG